MALVQDLKVKGESLVIKDAITIGSDDLEKGVSNEKYDVQPRTDGVFWINPNPVTNHEKLISYAKLCLLALPWIGVQCIWAAEFGTTTPYLQAMGLSEQWASNIWLSGPLMGFFIAPIVLFLINVI
eukprot:Awhi_evm1s15118